MFLIFALFMQVQIQLQVGVPTVRFEVAPPMVEVRPGVLVVNDIDDEVFFVDHRYWMRAPDQRWYQARDYRGGWVLAEPNVVPAPIVRTPPGHYKHYKGRPEKFRVANADGSVTEYKVKHKHGRTEVKVKHKKRGKWK